MNMLRCVQTGGADPLDVYCGDNPDADECRCARNTLNSNTILFPLKVLSHRNPVCKTGNHGKSCRCMLTIRSGYPSVSVL